MRKHTPGPWMIRAERYRFIHVYADGGGIAHLDTIDGEGAANARLIAASPDLLVALKNMVSLASPYFIDGPQREAIREARAAIAKAEGSA